MSSRDITNGNTTGNYGERAKPRQPVQNHAETTHRHTESRRNHGGFRNAHGRDLSAGPPKYCPGSEVSTHRSVDGSEALRGRRRRRREQKYATDRSLRKYRAHERRHFAVTHLGGECEWCGYRKYLEIDHRLPWYRYASGARRMPAHDGVIQCWRAGVDAKTHFTLLCQECHKIKTREDRAGATRMHRDFVLRFGSPDQLDLF